MSCKRLITCDDHHATLTPSEPHEETPYCMNPRPVDSPAPQATPDALPSECPKCHSRFGPSPQDDSLQRFLDGTWLCEYCKHEWRTPSPAETGASEPDYRDPATGRPSVAPTIAEITAATPIPEDRERERLKRLAKEYVDKHLINDWEKRLIGEMLVDFAWQAARKAEGR